MSVRAAVVMVGVRAAMVEMAMEAVVTAVVVMVGAVTGIVTMVVEEMAVVMVSSTNQLA